MNSSECFNNRRLGRPKKVCFLGRFLFITVGLALFGPVLEQPRADQQAQVREGHQVSEDRWLWLKEYVERTMRAQTGRALTIGDLDLEIARITRIVAKDLALENATNKPAYMLKLGRLELHVDVVKLLEGEVVIPKITIIDPWVLLEAYGGGQTNWGLMPQPWDKGAAQTPVIQQLTLEDGRFVYRNQKQGSEISATLALLEGRMDRSTQAVRLEGHGHYAGRPVDLQIEVGRGSRLSEPNHPNPVEARLKLGETVLQVNGNVQKLVQLQGLDVHFVLVGPGSADLAAVVPNVPKDLPAYRLEGDLAHKANVWHLAMLEVRLGKSDFSGSGSLAADSQPWQVAGDFSSKQLDLESLVALSLKNKKQRDERLFPDTPLNTEYFGKLQGQVSLGVQRVTLPRLALHDARLGLAFDQGQLHIEPLKFQVTDGTVEARIVIDARSGSANTSLAVDVDNVPLQEVLAPFGVSGKAYGPLQGHAELEGMGRSLDAFVTSVDGELMVMMEDGHLKSLLVQLAGLDLWGALMSLSDVSDETAIRCAVANFKAQEGVLDARSLIIDTTETKFVGKGSINLAEETVDLAIQPRAKDFSLLSADAMLHLTGALTNLSVSTDVSQALLSLLTPIELGLSEHANCEAILEHVRRDAADVGPRD